MRKLFTLMVLLLSCSSLFAQEWVSIGGNTPDGAKLQLQSTDSKGSVFSLSLNGYFRKQVSTPQGDAWIISVPKATQIQEAGAPDLPKFASSFVIPDMARMGVRVLSSRYEEYTNVLVAPSKGNLLRTVDPETVPYTFGSIYSEGRLFPGVEAELRTPHIVRDLRGQTVVVNPFQYNAATKTLRVYYEMTIELYVIDQNGENIISRNGLAHITPEFNQIYQNHFLNYSSQGSRYTAVGEEGRMIVIAYGDFMNTMQPFVEWKNMRGIPTTMVNVSTIGSTSTAIKSYIQNEYDAGGLAYVLLVGDNAQIPTNSGSGLGGPSDVAYSYLAGGDHYPDIFVGRFSAENIGHVATQVTRTLNYEKNPQLTSDDWYTTCLGIASDQGPGDDNEYDYQHIRGQQTDLMAYTYTKNPELFDGSQGGNDASGNPTASMVSTEVNDGSGIIVYTGHGSNNSWGTTGFSNTNVGQLTNQDKLPFIWSVACVNGEFMNSTCFAESWLRAEKNGQPTGAVAFLGSTINQSWNPPMCGQDEMVDILVESYNDNIKRTFGGLSMNGCMKMNDEYGTGGNEMTDTWTIFGDPSLMVRTDNPVAITANHNPTAFIGSTSFNVNCASNDAKVTLSINGAILGSALVSNGSATVNFAALTTPNDTIDVVITKYNTIPYMGRVPVVPANGPYVVYNTNVVNDGAGNGNGIPEYGEAVTLNLAVKNIGVDPTSNAIVKLRTSDPYITISDSTEVYGVISPNQIKNMDNAYALNISSTVPNQHAAVIYVVTDDNGTIWNSQFTLLISASDVRIASTTVIDPTGNNDGRLDPGENDEIQIKLNNQGAAGVTNLTAILATGDPFVNITTPNGNFGTIAAGGYGQQNFNVSVAEFTPGGHSALFTLILQGDNGYQKNVEFSLVIGRIPVLVVDLDGNTNSGPVIQNTINGLSITSEYTTTLPTNPNLYQAIFMCLGTYPKAHVLTPAEAQKYIGFLEQGGRMYMEGGDTWYFDQNNTPTNLHPMFKVKGKSDNGGDITNVLGASGEFTSGVTLTYSGDEQYIDKLQIVDTSFIILSNQTTAFDLGIAYDGGVYRTIGTSLEFGGYVDGSAAPSTKASLMEQYLDFFGIHRAPMWAAFIASNTAPVVGNQVSFTDLSSQGFTNWEWTFEGGVPSASTLQNPTVVYPTIGSYDVTLHTWNADSTKTITKFDYIKAQEGVGIGNAEATVSMSIYPNPSISGEFTVRTIASNATIRSIEVISITGQVIERRESVSDTDTYQFKLDKAGIYLIRVLSDKGVTTNKVIVR